MFSLIQLKNWKQFSNSNSPFHPQLSGGWGLQSEVKPSAIGVRDDDRFHTLLLSVGM